VVQLRPFTDADLDAVVALFTASVHGLTAAYYDAAQRAAWAPPNADLDAWRARLVDRVLLAESTGTLAGFIAFAPQGQIKFLYTDPGLARRGVATALYQAAEAELRELGVEEASTEASAVARSFFARQGFEVIEKQRITRGGVELHRYAMRKRLRRAPD
jgi:putative acetyltransferase